MIRKVYIDFIKNKLSKGESKWFFKRMLQYFLINASFLVRRPLCGPILATFVTNYNCSYRCKMCDISKREEQIKKKGYSELSTQQLKQLIKDFAQLGVSGIGFTGGEPLLRKDIYELLSFSKDSRLITHLNTNGFLLDKESAAELVKAGLDSVNISLDGAKAETHDSIRGYSGAFERVVKAVGYVNAARKEAKAAFRLKVVAVVSEKNIDEVRDLAALSEKLGADCIEFIPVQNFIFSDGKPSSFDEGFLRKIRDVQKYLLEARKKSSRIENSPRHIKMFEKSFKNIKSGLTCFAAYNSYAVDCYGEIFPCVPWVNWGKSVGNIRNSSLKEFWYSAGYNRMRGAIFRCKNCYLNCQAELNLLFNL